MAEHREVGNCTVVETPDQTLFIFVARRDTERLARLAYRVLVIAGAMALATFVYGAIFAPFDDTDGDGVRSGLRLHVDHRTGCQYLATSAGALVPRLRADGTTMCGGR